MPEIARPAPENVITSTGLFNELDALYGASGGQNPGMLQVNPDPVRLVHDVSQGGAKALLDGITHSREVIDLSGGGTVNVEPFDQDDRRTRVLMYMLCAWSASVTTAAYLVPQTNIAGSWYNLNIRADKFTAAGTAENLSWIPGIAVPHNTQWGGDNWGANPFGFRYVLPTWKFRYSARDAGSPVAGTATVDLIYCDAPAGVEVPSP